MAAVVFFSEKKMRSCNSRRLLLGREEEAELEHTRGDGFEHDLADLAISHFRHRVHVQEGVPLPPPDDPVGIDTGFRTGDDEEQLSEQHRARLPGVLG